MWEWLVLQLPPVITKAVESQLILIPLAAPASTATNPDLPFEH
jgi:hypothetical protein